MSDSCAYPTSPRLSPPSDRELANDPSSISSPISNLPPELLLTIIDHAHHSALFTLTTLWPQSAPHPLVRDYLSFLHSISSVSRTWRALALNHSSLWSTIPIVDPASGCTFNLSLHLARSGCRPLTLMINSWTKSLQSALDTLSTTRALGRVKELDIAVLRSSSSIAFTLGSTHFPALERLRITGGVLPGPPDWHWLALHGFTLKSLSLGHCAVPSYTPPGCVLPKLEKLMLRGTETHYLPLLASPLPELRELHLLHRGPGSEIWRSYAPLGGCGKLEVLAVEGGAHEEVILGLLCGSRGLREFRLAGDVRECVGLERILRFVQGEGEGEKREGEGLLRSVVLQGGTVELKLVRSAPEGAIGKSRGVSAGVGSACAREVMVGEATGLGLGMEEGERKERRLTLGEGALQEGIVV